jgi:hypothetical protein
MMTIKIRPGDTVELVAVVEKPTPFGSKETETTGLKFTYEELVYLIKLKGGRYGQPKNTNTEEEGNSTYTSESLPSQRGAD